MLAACYGSRSACPSGNHGESDKRCKGQQPERRTFAASGKSPRCTSRNNPPRPTKDSCDSLASGPSKAENLRSHAFITFARILHGTIVGTAAPNAACPGRVKELLRRAPPSRPAWPLWNSRERHGTQARKRLDHGARGVETRHGRTQRSSQDDSGSCAKSGDSLS